MISATPQLQLETLFVLGDRGRILSTREPQPSPGPAFMLIRGSTEVAWAVRDDVAHGVADELDRLARQEPVSSEWERSPIHARLYQALLRGRVGWGPAFRFPESVGTPGGAAGVHQADYLCDGLEHRRVTRHLAVAGCRPPDHRRTGPARRGERERWIVVS